MDSIFSSSKDCCTKFDTNLQFTMDYDSGYMSHNPESNSDSSLETSTDNLLKKTCSKPVYFSEDALLETPIIINKYPNSNVKLEIEKEDYEETRNLFNMSDSESVIPSSVVSVSDDNRFIRFDSSESDTSIEIPPAKPIVFDFRLRKYNDFSTRPSLICSVPLKNLSNLPILGKIKEQKIEAPVKSGTNNISSPNSLICSVPLETIMKMNIPATSDPKKKLTLIFSKANENRYSVKRKYRSLTPEQNKSSGKVENCSEESELETSSEESELETSSFDTSATSHMLETTHHSVLVIENSNYDNSQMQESMEQSFIAGKLESPKNAEVAILQESLIECEEGDNLEKSSILYEKMQETPPCANVIIESYYVKNVFEEDHIENIPVIGNILAVSPGSTNNIKIEDDEIVDSLNSVTCETKYLGTNILHDKDILETEYVEPIASNLSSNFTPTIPSVSENTTFEGEHLIKTSPVSIKLETKDRGPTEANINSQFSPNKSSIKLLKIENIEPIEKNLKINPEFSRTKLSEKTSTDFNYENVTDGDENVIKISLGTVNILKTEDTEPIKTNSNPELIQIKHIGNKEQVKVAFSTEETRTSNASVMNYDVVCEATKNDESINVIFGHVQQYNNVDNADSVISTQDKKLVHNVVFLNADNRRYSDIHSISDMSIEYVTAPSMNSEQNFDTLVPSQAANCTSSSAKLSKHISNILPDNLDGINKEPSSFTPKKAYINSVDPDVSPDLFSEDEAVPDTIKLPSQPLNYIAKEQYITKKDERILRRTQNSLKGVLPPRSITVSHISVNEILNRLENNKAFFWDSATVTNCEDRTNESLLNSSGESSVCGESKSLLVNGSLGDAKKTGFPNILMQRNFGLYHNRSKISEELEELWAKFGERYVGAETQSTCTIFEANCVSPRKKVGGATKPRWTANSPGRRLSHLARRRITFSSATLQAAGSSALAGVRTRQILVDAKKLDMLNIRHSPRKTPKKTPNKSPRKRTRTPSSSAKKKLALRFRRLAGEIECAGGPSTQTDKPLISGKRTLFSSPEKKKPNTLFMPASYSLSLTFEDEPNSLAKKPTKRALFMSPNKKSPLKNLSMRSPFKRLDLGFEKKRKREEDAEDAKQPSKMPRSMSVEVRASDGAQSLCRTKSDSILSAKAPQQEMTAAHKKKLQWAVYEALRAHNVAPTHSQFKVFASILGRVVRKLMYHMNAGSCIPHGGSTSERMLRFAKRHSLAVVKGASVEEVIGEYTRMRLKWQKPQGYIGIEEFNAAKDKENQLHDRTRTLESLEKRKLEELQKPKVGGDNRIERIRKVINFGDDDR